jgi:hypothetical protein
MSDPSTQSAVITAYFEAMENQANATNAVFQQYAQQITDFAKASLAAASGHPA